jgi:glucokinase
MDVGNIAELNTFLVLDAIRSAGQATRAQLAAELGLSNASISRIVKRLLEQEIIEEAPSEGGLRGRIPTVLRFVGTRGGVIAVDLGGTRCHGALADLAGVTVARDDRLIGDSATAALLACIKALESAAANIRMPVEALVVGIPALIDPATGLATAGPNVHWDGFDLVGALGQELHERFEVDNDVNLAALGQAWRGAGRSLQSFVTISLGTGIGGAVVVDGHLLRGRHSAAGEVGYLLVAAAGQISSNQHLPSFEAVASGPALRARAADLIAAGATTTLHDPFGVEDVFAAALAGDALGEQIVAELVDHLATAIVGVIAVLDPERIILDGRVGRALEPWLPQLVARVEGMVFARPDIVVSSLGADATVVGATARALALVYERDAPRSPRAISLPS